jgi:hypothetical protein
MVRIMADVDRAGDTDGWEVDEDNEMLTDADDENTGIIQTVDDGG